MQQDSDNSSRLSHKSALDVQFTYGCEESYSVNKPALARSNEPEVIRHRRITQWKQLDC
jgi:hypothetical protein